MGHYDDTKRNRLKAILEYVKTKKSIKPAELKAWIVFQYGFKDVTAYQYIGDLCQAGVLKREYKKEKGESVGYIRKA